MNFKLYAVVDRKAKAIVTVFSSMNNETAVRSFIKLCATPHSLYNNYYQDFSLYPVAECEFKGNVITVNPQDCENLINNGFKIGGFSNSEPVLDGYDIPVKELDRLLELNYSKIKEEENKE